MKISEYPAVSELATDNVFIIDGSNGTKKIAASDLRYALFNSLPSMHRKLYRGKSLGTTFTTEQKTAVQEGTFDDLWVGDYWTIGDYDYIIADMDYFYKEGETDNVNALQSHHLLMIPNKSMGKSRYVSSNSGNSRGYANSLARSSLTPIRSTITNAFGSSVLTFKMPLVTEVTNGWVQTIQYYDCQAELLTEAMCFGAAFESQMFGNDRGAQNISDLNARQLALFDCDPSFIKLSSTDPNTTSGTYWLQDPASNNGFCLVTGNGRPGGSSVSSTGSEMGLRPFFLIG